MNVTGNIDTLKKFAAALRTLPREVADKVASAAAPSLTAAVKATFSASQDAYGAAWKAGSKGQTVTLQDTGALAGDVKYTANGPTLRVALGPAYAKYQIGKRPIFPRQGTPLPTSHTDALAKAVNDVIREHLEVAS